MTRRAVFSILIIFLLMWITGCGEQVSVDSYVATALAETAAMETSIVEWSAATIAAIPTKTLTPTPTLTPTLTPYPPVTATVVLNAYCRPGPDVIYGQGKLLNRGDSVMVVGRVDDVAAWLLVQQAEDTDSCWIASEALSITGETAWVEIVLAPPTPTPPPSWTGTWTVWLRAGESAVEVSSVGQFIQTGDQLYASLTFTYPNYSGKYVIEGVVSADGLTVHGAVTNQNPPFTMYLVRSPSEINQFRGRWVLGSISWSFCGTRIPGGTKPNPCIP